MHLRRPSVGGGGSTHQEHVMNYPRCLDSLC
jgi:hypothetical protein